MPAVLILAPLIWRLPAVVLIFPEPVKLVPPLIAPDSEKLVTPDTAPTILAPPAVTVSPPLLTVKPEPNIPTPLMLRLPVCGVPGVVACS